MNERPPSEGDAESSSNTGAKQTRSFVRAFAATSYLLGRRRQALAEGLTSSDPTAHHALAEIVEQLGHSVQEQRARALAAEVARLMRALDAQRLK